MRRLERTFTRNRSSDIDTAERIRETFVDRPAEKHESMPWDWPKRMKEVGSWTAGEGAICYTSDKWQKRRDQFVDYKHVAEGPQRLLVIPGFLREYHRPGTKLSVGGPMVEVDGPMPTAFARLAPILGLQAHLYEGTDTDYALNGDDGYYQINIANAELGGAIHPGTGKPFLFVFTKSAGVLCMILGSELAVEKDGIVG